nr:ABC transporter substrate-binding protein [Paracoccus suum]
MPTAGEIRAGVLRVDTPTLPPASRLDLPPPDLGLVGAELATRDNATTGGFLGQTFTTETATATPQDAVAKLERLIDGGSAFIVVMADDAQTLALADAARAKAGDKVLILNALAEGDDLRGDDCRANVIHVAASRAMKSDALAQFLMWKRWGKWYLVEGSHPRDKALAAAYARAATKFGAKLVETREFTDTGGGRRTDTGYVQIQQQMPVFTQRAPGHDVLVAADEAGTFAPYLPYQTWDARPVVGSAGLTPVTWHPAAEAWGGTQLQTRFEALAHRPMREADYQVWLALRLLGEAASRAPSTDFAALRDRLLGPQFEVGAFKGQKLTIRDWDHQLRQPILLATPAIVASVSPQDQYLHQTSALDTLGIDRPESTCKLK